MELVAAYWDDHRHFLLCEMSPMLDLKRCLQLLHARVERFTGWSDLTFLWAPFISAISFGVFEGFCFFMNCSSPIGSFCIFCISIDQIDFYPQQGVFEPILESMTLGFMLLLHRCWLWEEDLFGIWAMCPAHQSWWWVMMLSRLSIFERRRTLLFMICFCHVLHRIWWNFIWWNFSSLQMSLW